MPSLLRLPPHLSSILVLGLLAGCSACSTTLSPERAGDPEAELDPKATPPVELPSPESPPTVAPPDGDLLAAELSTVGWDALSGSPVVLLREIASGQVLPIWIGAAEARAIGLALHGIDTPRPMTHDLMANLLAQLGATLEEVVVTELREGIYYGLLKLRVDGEEPRWVDTRPSDGLALALRTGATIRVAAGLVENQPDFQFLAPEIPDQVVRVLGLTVRAPTPELREEHGLPERDGLVVIAVSDEAERQGLARGDLIVGVNGRTPGEPLDLLEAIRDAPDRVLTLVYWRDGEEHTVKLEIGPESTPQREGKIAAFDATSRGPTVKLLAA